MAKSIPFSVTNLTANSVTIADTEVANSRYNPPKRTSRFSVYACANATPAARISVSAGAEGHADDVPFPYDANLALSTRDHLVASGVVLQGEKVTVGYRETAGAGTVDIVGLVVLEPIA